MDLKYAKELFQKHHPEEADNIKMNGPGKRYAAYVWHGFKSALVIMGHLEVPVIEKVFNAYTDDELSNVFTCESSRHRGR